MTKKPDWWTTYHSHCENLGEALAEEIQALLEHLGVETNETCDGEFLHIKVKHDRRQCGIAVQLVDED